MIAEKYGDQPNIIYEICDDGTPPLCDQATVTITVIDPDSELNNPPIIFYDFIISL